MKHWLIVGASRGLGLSLARTLCAAGDRVTAIAQRAEAKHAALEAEYGGRLRYLHADVRSERELRRVFDVVVRFMEGAHHPIGNVIAMLVPATTIRAFISGRRDPTTMRLLEDQGGLDLGGRLPGVRDGRAMLDALLDLIEARRLDLDEDRGDALGTILRRARDAGQAYTNEQALDETLTLLLAGHDTTAITLAWLLYRLARAPRVVARLREELDAAFGAGPIDTRAIERLPYLSAVLDEGFRLDGIGRAVGRRTLRPTTIAGYALPAETFVLAYTHGRNRSTSAWERRLAAPGGRRFISAAAA